MIETITITFKDGETHDIEWEEDGWTTEDGRNFTRLDEAIMHAHTVHNDNTFRLQRSTLTPR